MTDKTILPPDENIVISFKKASTKKAAGRKNDHASTPDENAAAREFAERYGSELKYNHSRGCWIRWTKTHWARDTHGSHFEQAREVAEWHGGARRMAFTRNVVGYARFDPRMATVSEDWDRDPWLLGTPDGTVDLCTGEMRSPNPADMISKVTRAAPAPTADCPRFLKFLGECTGDDKGVIRFLQQFFGLCLTGDVSEHQLLFLFGDGLNGKSVLQNTINRILNDYAVTAGMEALMASSHDRHSTEIAMLAGVRMVTASETEEGRAWAEVRIKQLTSSDPITARFMRQDNFTFMPTHKLIIIGNNKPKLSTVDDAIRRRINMVPFIRKPAKPDPKLEQKLQAEYPGILRWMLDGCLDRQRNGLVRSQVVIAATSEYFEDQDVFRHWLDAECDCEPANPYKTGTSAELYAAWSAFAKRAVKCPAAQAPSLRG